MAVLIESKVAHTLLFQLHQLGNKLLQAIPELATDGVVEHSAKPRLRQKNFTLFPEEHEERGRDGAGLILANGFLPVRVNSRRG